MLDRRILTLLVALALLIGRSAAVAQDAGPGSLTSAATRLRNPANPTLYVVGDSTVVGGTGARVGWARPFSGYLRLDKLNYVDAARGGKSSRSFRDEGFWTGIAKRLGPGDIVLIQFGHNDSGSLDDPKGGDRPSLPGTGDDTVEAVNPWTHQRAVVHSFGWYIRQYVGEAITHGASVVVLSPVPKNTWNKDGVLVPSWRDYVAWARTAAEASGGRFADVNAAISKTYRALGEKKVMTLFADGVVHTNQDGAATNAAAVVSVLKGLPGHPFDDYLNHNADGIAPFSITSP